MKQRNRGAIYPYEFLVRLDKEMGERMDQAIKDDPTLTKVGLARKALDKILPKKKSPTKEQV